MPSSLPHADDFRAWLAKHTDLTKRSIGDVVSRARRAHGYIDVLKAQSAAEMIFRLQETAPFSACSPSIRSQLKRAARLYHQFTESRA